MSVSGPNFVADPQKELAKMDQRFHMTDYRRHDLSTLILISVYHFPS